MYQNEQQNKIQKKHKKYKKNQNNCARSRFQKHTSGTPLSLPVTHQEEVPVAQQAAKVAHH
jgi:hypothetical protein